MFMVCTPPTVLSNNRGAYSRSQKPQAESISLGALAVWSLGGKRATWSHVLRSREARVGHERCFHGAVRSEQLLLHSSDSKAHNSTEAQR